jgi:hypothetical protein
MHTLLGKQWCSVRAVLHRHVDNLPVISVLQKIWDTAQYTFLCTGGDFPLPGAKKQTMHSDMVWVGNRPHKDVHTTLHKGDVVR